MNRFKVGDLSVRFQDINTGEKFRRIDGTIRYVKIDSGTYGAEYPMPHGADPYDYPPYDGPARRGHPDDIFVIVNP